MTEERVISGETRTATDRVELDVPWSHEFAQNKYINYNDRSFIYCSLLGPNCTFYKC